MVFWDFFSLLRAFLAIGYCGTVQLGHQHWDSVQLGSWWRGDLILLTNMLDIDQSENKTYPENVALYIFGFENVPRPLSILFDLHSLAAWIYMINLYSSL